MKRPISWLHWLLVLCLLLIAGEGIALMWLAPHYVMRVVESAVGGTLRIRHARLTFPLTTTLQGVHAVNSSPHSSLSIQRVVIRPRWLSVPTRTLWLDTVRLEQPLLRLSRSPEGAMQWPSLPTPPAGPQGIVPTASPSMATSADSSVWHIRINSLQIEDGTIELLDQQLRPPFHGVLHHISVVMGPLTLPWGGPHMSFAVRGELVGHSGEAAPVYCSGWVALPAKDLQASCQLEPLALAAFEPYYQQGNVKVRVYNATLKSTSQWLARSNALDGRVQMELGNLTEGDLSIHGRTVVDVKKLAGGEQPRLSAEVTITGPLDDPTAWRSDFVPGDTVSQQLVQPLLDRGIEMINVPFGGRKIRVSITPASPATMSSIEEVSKQVEQDLEILVAPIPPAVLSEPSPAAQPGAPPSGDEAPIPSSPTEAGTPPH